MWSVGLGLLFWAWMGAEIALAQPQIDGAILQEYANHYIAEGIGMEIHWTVEGESIYLGLRSPAQGWLAIGWDPSGAIMDGEDVLIAYVRNGELFLQDFWANSSVNHASDVTLGCRDDLLESSGSEDDSGTTVEFRRLLETNDPCDRPLTPGTHTVQLAYAPSDDFVSYHGDKRTVVEIDFLGGSAQGIGLFARPREAGGDVLRHWGWTVGAGVIVILSLSGAVLIWPRRTRRGGPHA